MKMKNVGVGKRAFRQVPSTSHFKIVFVSSVAHAEADRPWASTFKEK